MSKEYNIISEGERWTIFDILDAEVVATFDSWRNYDPEARAREFFKAYPRRAALQKEKVVKYDREWVETNWDEEEDTRDASPAEPGAEAGS